MIYTTRRPARARKVHFPDFGTIVNELLNTPSHTDPRSQNNVTTPAVNVIKADDRHTLQLVVPGHSKKDIKITLDNDVITIQSTKEAVVTEGAEYRLKEFNYEGFERSFTLPETVDQNRIEASFKDGILTITLMKKEEAVPQPAKTIKIK